MEARVTAAGSKRERTRAHLIEVCAKLFERDGILATSLDQIASAAGVTKGAIYSNFKNKDDLVLAVMLKQDLQMKPDMRPGMSPDEILRAIGKAVAALVSSASGKSKLIAEYHLYAVSSEHLRIRVARHYTERLNRLILGVKTAQLHKSTRLSARRLVLAIEALATGFIVQAMLMPDVIGEKDIVAAFEALAVA